MMGYMENVTERDRRDQENNIIDSILICLLTHLINMVYLNRFVKHEWRVVNNSYSFYII